MSNDLTLPWCTYETRFSNGLYYRGKGKTPAVLAGTYTGSGTRYKLALLHYRDSLYSGEITTVTSVITTHATEDEAYTQEELFVPISLLADPMCLNMHAGGTRGKYKTPGQLMRQIMAEKRRNAKEAKKIYAALKKSRAAKELRELKAKLKEKK